MVESGVEDAAIMLMSMGEEEASEVFKHLLPKEVQRLGETIAKLKAVPRERYEAVVENFLKLAEAEHLLVADSDEYVRSVLRKALGEEKASLLLERILAGNDVTGIESLKWMEAQSVAELLRNEHPQIVAAILVHLEYDQTSQVLKLLPDRMRNEVLMRVATLDGIQPAALKDLNEVLSNVLSGSDRARKSQLGGVKSAAEILNMMGSSVETSVLDYIRESDGDLAQKIMDNMFTFDDMIKLDDKAIQMVLKEVQSESLVISLKGATPDPPAPPFTHTSSRPPAPRPQHLATRPPLRVADVDAAQTAPPPRSSPASLVGDTG